MNTGVRFGYIKYFALACCMFLVTATVQAQEPLMLKYKFSLQFKGMEENSYEISHINIGSNRTDVRVETYNGQIVLKPGKTTYFNLTVRRPFIPNDGLGIWRKDITQGKFLKKDGLIRITDETGEVVAKYMVEGAWPSEQHLDAFFSSERPVMETIVFAAEKITRTE